MLRLLGWSPLIHAAFDLNRALFAPVPPLEPLKTTSTETFSTPPSPRSPRQFTSSGQSEADSEESSRRSRKSSGGRRSRSASRTSRRPPRAGPSQPPQPATQPRRPSGSSATDAPAAADRNRSNSEPEVLAVPSQAPVRPYSTIVEVASEYRSPKYFFRESRQPPKTKELEMHAAIKQLRKIK